MRACETSAERKQAKGVLLKDKAISRDARRVYLRLPQLLAEAHIHKVYAFMNSLLLGSAWGP